MGATVTLPWSPTWEALEWAKKHCPSYITNSAATSEKTGNGSSPVYIEYYINYHFSDPKDAILFRLMWS